MYRSACMRCARDALRFLCVTESECCSLRVSVRISVSCVCIMFKCLRLGMLCLKNKFQ